MKAVNLIPSEHRRATPSGKGSGGAYVVLGVLAVLLLMAVAYVTTSNSLNDKKSKTAAARQEADAAEGQTKQLGSFTDFASIKDERLAAVTAAAQTRFDWERFMRELSRVMPHGSWISNTTASVTGEGVGAGTAAADPAAVVVPKANLVGCTPRQSEVARMMVRLEQLYRVTDVTLNESSQESGETATTLQNCGRFYKFDITLSFSPAPPSSEAPSGEARVPASLGGGS
jgi:Tfp pilus assembly protein PilN